MLPFELIRNTLRRPWPLAAVLALAVVVTAESAAASELRLARGPEVVSSLQPEDFPTPPGAPLTPVRLSEAANDWRVPVESWDKKDGPAADARCNFDFRASINSGGERYGRLSRIQMSHEPLHDPPGERYRWRLTRGVERCKYRIYLGRGPSLTRVEPTYMDTRTGYYDHRFGDRPRFSHMIVWARRVPEKKRRDSEQRQ